MIRVAHAGVGGWGKNVARVVGEVTEHGLNTVTSEIYRTILINDDYGIRIFLQEAVELGLAQHEIPLKSSPC